MSHFVPLLGLTLFAGTAIFLINPTATVICLVLIFGGFLTILKLPNYSFETMQREGLFKNKVTEVKALPTLDLANSGILRRIPFFGFLGGGNA